MWGFQELGKARHRLPLDPPGAALGPGPAELRERKGQFRRGQPRLSYLRWSEAAGQMERQAAQDPGSSSWPRQLIPAEGPR